MCTWKLRHGIWRESCQSLLLAGWPQSDTVGFLLLSFVFNQDRIQISSYMIRKVVSRRGEEFNLNGSSQGNSSSTIRLGVNILCDDCRPNSSVLFSTYSDTKSPKHHTHYLLMQHILFCQCVVRTIVVFSICCVILP